MSLTDVGNIISRLTQQACNSGWRHGSHCLLCICSWRLHQTQSSLINHMYEFYTREWCTTILYLTMTLYNPLDSRVLTKKHYDIESANVYGQLSTPQHDICAQQAFCKPYMLFWLHVAMKKVSDTKTQRKTQWKTANTATEFLEYWTKIHATLLTKTQLSHSLLHSFISHSLFLTI